MIDDEGLENLEQRLGSLTPSCAPLALRAAVLADVRHELRAARWDRRLSRAVAALLVVGVGMNVTVGLSSVPSAGLRVNQLASDRSQQPSQQALARTAALLADATDVETGRWYARHLVMMSGRELTADDAAAIDAAIQQRPPRAVNNGGDG